VHKAEECNLTEALQPDKKGKKNRKEQELKVSTALHSIVEDDEASQGSDE
jgi:hypothetical protein